MSKHILELKNISKSFGDTKVLNNLSLTIDSGEFITILGASGCGKTTTLRIIAGLETVDEGQVFLENTDVTNLEPNKRNVNTVFQNYALFPHMNVEKNIGYSLKIKKVNKSEIDTAVKKALKLVQLEGFEKRMPNELSGGQKQRVAIARAIVNQPKILLLDEPLGALDLQLRQQMQIELKKLQKQLGITFIYITHDQEEALNMSDRIIIMKNGNFEQIGTPKDIYERPFSSYVAEFVGNSNIISGKIIDIGSDTITMNVSNTNIKVRKPSCKIEVGQNVRAAFHSESAIISPTQEGNYLVGKITDKSFSGGMLKLTAALEDGTIIVASQFGFISDINIDDTVFFNIKPMNITLVDLEG